MSLLHKGVQVAANRLPKVISPKTHAIIDYATAGSFILAGVLLMRKKHKKAAIGALVCGIAEATTAMLTDYPGGVAKLISFPTHGKIDYGKGGLIMAMPNLLGFDDKSPAVFFRMQSLAITAVTGMTDFETVSRRDLRGRRAA
jgi:hypothetical protein